jgi:hypothetical protein
VVDACALTLGLELLEGINMVDSLPARSSTKMRLVAFNPGRGLCRVLRVVGGQWEVQMAQLPVVDSGSAQTAHAIHREIGW